MNRPVNDFVHKACVGSMEPHHLTNWQWFAGIIGKDLDEGAIQKDIAFTLHDFSNHCYKIYENISAILKSCPAFNRELTSEALYLLNLAVLFHDYSMARPLIAEERLCHSELSREDFMKFCENNKETIKDKLKPRQIEIICDIIVAHSDIKSINDG
jgi:hypothetical protein